MDRIEIITVGDELIEGRLVDTNSCELSAKLADIGLRVAEHRSVGDEPDAMAEAFRTAAARADAVLVSGGLGPTSDDLTAEVAAAAFDTGITRFDEALEHTRRFFAERGREMPATNEKQADLPTTCRILPNPEGTAVGFLLDVGRCRLYFMPGVPRELRRMADESVIPDLRRRMVATPPSVATLKLFGQGESEVAQRLAGIGASLDDGLRLTVQYRATFPEIHIRLVLEGADHDLVHQTLVELTSNARKRLGTSVFAVGGAAVETDFPAAVAEALAEHGLTVAVVEVSSGGNLCRFLSASQTGRRALRGGIIAPDAEALGEQLGVGSVSGPAVADAVRERFVADIGVATLGSHDGSDGNKPGTLIVAAVGPAGMRDRELFFPIDPDRFQRLGAYAGLRLVMGVAGVD
jgi:nicotinamide-nucleotide amidase